MGNTHDAKPQASPPLTLQDELRVEGVDSHGFGLVYKAVMCYPQLSLTAKIIYTYLRVAAGQGNTSFPGVQRILDDLQLCPTTYRRHFHMLTDLGLVTYFQRKSENNTFMSNVYTLPSEPKCIDLLTGNDDVPLSANAQIIHTGLKQYGYGICPRAILMDKRLSLQAKGLYAYFAALLGAGTSAFPSTQLITYHLNVSQRSYYEYLKELTSLNYIQTVQRHQNGRFSCRDVYLIDCPDEAHAQTQHIIAAVTSTDAHGGSPIYRDNALNHMIDNKASHRVPSVVSSRQDDDVPEEGTTATTLPKIDRRASVSSPIPPEEPTPVDGVSQAEPDDSDDDGERIVNNIRLAGYIPESCLSDASSIEHAVHWICEWDIMYPNGYTDEYQQRVYNLMVATLIEMLSTKNEFKVYGGLISAKAVLKRVNEAIHIIEGGVDATEFTEPAMTYYQNASMNGPIHNPVQYMKSCIWTALQSGDMETFRALKSDGFKLNRG